MEILVTGVAMAIHSATVMEVVLERPKTLGSIKADKVAALVIALDLAPVAVTVQVMGLAFAAKVTAILTSQLGLCKVMDEEKRAVRHGFLFWQYKNWDDGRGCGCGLYGYGAEDGRGFGDGTRCGYLESEGDGFGYGDQDYSLGAGFGEGGYIDSLAWTVIRRA